MHIYTNAYFYYKRHGLGHATVEVYAFYIVGTSFTLANYCEKRATM